MSKVVLCSCMILIVFFLQLTLSCEREQVKLVPDEYTSWDTTTETELNYPIPGHMDHYRRIYINPTGTEVSIENVQNRRKYTYPEGTIIIKDVYESLQPEPGQEPVKQTVMIKDSHNPRSRGGWLWIIKDLKTSREQIIGSEFCFDCHANANEEHPYGDGNPRDEFRDYLFFPYEK